MAPDPSFLSQWGHCQSSRSLAWGANWDFSSLLSVSSPHPHPDCCSQDPQFSAKCIQPEGAAAGWVLPGETTPPTQIPFVLQILTTFLQASVSYYAHRVSVSASSYKGYFPSKGQKWRQEEGEGPHPFALSPAHSFNKHIWRICLVTGTRLGNINMNRIQFLT